VIYFAGDFNYTTYQAGSQYGLNLLLNVNQDDYISASLPSAGFSVSTAVLLLFAKSVEDCSKFHS